MALMCFTVAGKNNRRRSFIAQFLSQTQKNKNKNKQDNKIQNKQNTNIKIKTQRILSTIGVALKYTAWREEKNGGVYSPRRRKMKFLVMEV